MGKEWKQCQSLFLGAPKSLQRVIAAMKLRYLLLEIKAMTKQDSILKSRDITDKSPSSQSYGFSSSHVWMWELDHKESWALKNWCFWIVVLGKTLESPMDCKEIKQVSPKGNQSWIFIGRTEAEAPIFWPLDVKNCLIGKDHDAGKDWRQEEKGKTENEMVGWRPDMMDMNLSKLRETVKEREAWHAAVHRVTKNQTWLSDWTTIKKRRQRIKITLDSWTMKRREGQDWYKEQCRY